MSLGGQSSSRGLPRRPYGLLAMTSVSLSLTLPDGSPTPKMGEGTFDLSCEGSQASLSGRRCSCSLCVMAEE